MESIANPLDGPLAEALAQLENLKSHHSGCREEIDRLKRESENNAALAHAAREELRYFVYAASHDLQGPLRTMTNYAQLLERDKAQSPQSKEFLKFIIDGAAQMSALVRGLLTYSQSGNTPRIAVVNASGPLQMALYRLAGPIREAAAKVNVQDLPEISADEEQMATVFEHLISNALKYHGGRTPKIEMSAEEGDEFHVIAIRDNGEGIAPEHHEKVFEPFKRLHGEDVPGSGLGLAICRKIIRAHGGKIWVESDGSSGSNFRFTVPV
jgi:signal transduction histidine kinase